MDGTDGWRYWWDTAAQQWQQHSWLDAPGSAGQPEQQAVMPGVESARAARERDSVLSPIFEGDTPAASPAMPTRAAASWDAPPSGQAAATDWEDSFGVAADAKPSAALLAQESRQHSVAPSTAADGSGGAASEAAHGPGGPAWSHTAWQEAPQAAPFAAQDAAAADDWQLVSQQDAWQAEAVPQQQAQQPWQQESVAGADQQAWQPEGPPASVPPSQQPQGWQPGTAASQPWRPAGSTEAEQAPAPMAWPQQQQHGGQLRELQPAVFQMFGAAQPSAGPAPATAPGMFVPSQGPARTASPAGSAGGHTSTAAGQPAGGAATFAGAAQHGTLAVAPTDAGSSMAVSAGQHSLHGRPPSAFGKLLFGGRMLLAAPTGEHARTALRCVPGSSRPALAPHPLHCLSGFCSQAHAPAVSPPSLPGWSTRTVPLPCRIPSLRSACPLPSLLQASSNCWPWHGPRRSCCTLCRARPQPAWRHCWRSWRAFLGRWAAALTRTRWGHACGSWADC